jgi:hypothetical protein
VRLAGAVAVGVTGFALGIGFARQEGGEVSNAQNLERWTGERVRVEVLNGGGVPGMARTATERLRAAGFDVVEFGNASSWDEVTRVLDRVGRPEVAGAVAEALGIDNVLSEPDPNLYVDVTVVLGGAWTPEPLPDPTEARRSRAGWDPRTWFGN